MKKITLSVIMFLFVSLANAQTYRMPEEGLPHEGTWLQWPHQYQYGITYRDRLDATWVAMTQALISSEKVHIIAYDATEQTRITGLLNTAGVSLTNVDFKIHPTDDVWVRDNGPIFVKNTVAPYDLKIQDWGFNAWGGKFQFNNCNAIPSLLATDLALPVVNLNSTMINEGGSCEYDGNGAMMACKSSILSQSPANTVRNSGMTQAQAEAIFTANLGIEKFIWLNGVTGLEVTDMHIDGFARFANETTIVTMSQANLLDWGVPQTDINILMAATNKNNIAYNFTIVPLTVNNVVTTYGETLPYKGSYANYYIGNTKVLVPNYNDPNDAVANNIIAGLYPGRTVVGIDVRNLYKNGGMVHCVTQQQPTAGVLGINDFDLKEKSIKIYPNPAENEIQFNTTETIKLVEIYNELGQVLKVVNNNNSNNKVDISSFAKGVYFIKFITSENQAQTQKFIKK